MEKSVCTTLSRFYESSYERHGDTVWGKPNIKHLNTKIQKKKKLVLHIILVIVFYKIILRSKLNYANDKIFKTWIIKLSKILEH